MAYFLEPLLTSGSFRCTGAHAVYWKAWFCFIFFKPFFVLFLIFRRRKKRFGVAGPSKWLISTFSLQTPDNVAEAAVVDEAEEDVATSIAETSTVETSSEETSTVEILTGHSADVVAVTEVTEATDHIVVQGAVAWTDPGVVKMPQTCSMRMISHPWHKTTIEVKRTSQLDKLQDFFLLLLLM